MIHPLMKKFHVLSNPEFLAEGTAINDLLNPNRVLIGGNNQEAINALTKYTKDGLMKRKIIETNVWSSELSKLSANAFLAQRISSINTISAICERTSANIKEVSLTVGMDIGIGEGFFLIQDLDSEEVALKDVLSLIYL